MQPHEAEFARKHLALYDELTEQLDEARQALVKLERYRVPAVYSDGSFCWLVRNGELVREVSSAATVAVYQLLERRIEEMEREREGLASLCLAAPRPTPRPEECDVTSDCD